MYGLARRSLLLNRWGLSLLFALATTSPIVAQTATNNRVLHIDVPVHLTEANVVFNMDRLTFEGDNPAGLVFMGLMAKRFAEEKTKFRIVGVFHGPAGYFLLSDAAYNKVRKTKNGNPYKADIVSLQKIGIEFEECGQTMEENGWVNEDLLPGVKANSGANFRVIDLVQKNFVQIQP